MIYWRRNVMICSEMASSWLLNTWNKFTDWSQMVVMRTWNALMPWIRFQRAFCFKSDQRINLGSKCQSYQVERKLWVRWVWYSPFTSSSHRHCIAWMKLTQLLITKTWRSWVNTSRRASAATNNSAECRKQGTVNSSSSVWGKTCSSWQIN